MVPNTVRLLRHVEDKIGPSPRLKRRVSQAYSRLIKEGLLKRSAEKVVLTEKGTRLAEDFLRKEKFKNKPRKWDHKWRVIMFDVWERRRSVRDELRRALEEVGFVKIQNSVWVYPYPCEEFLVFLRTSLRLGRGILYVVADEIEHDEALRRHFKPPLF